METAQWSQEQATNTSLSKCSASKLSHGEVPQTSRALVETFTLRVSYFNLLVSYLLKTNTCFDFREKKKVSREWNNFR